MVSFDVGRHVRVDRRPRPRPPRTGVAALLASERGTTMMLYPCLSGHGRVLVELAWRLSESEKRQADAAAEVAASGDHRSVAKAIGDAFMCAVSFWHVRLVEVES